MKKSNWIKKYYEAVSKLSDDSGYFDHNFVIRFFSKQIEMERQEAISQTEQRVRGEIEEDIMTMHKGAEEDYEYKKANDYGFIGQSSVDYYHGILRGITLVGRYLNKTSKSEVKKGKI